MTERERLIELLNKARLEETYTTGDGKPVTSINRRIVDIGEVAILADYLLENGVIVPPCKAGDTVYFAHRFECRITEHKVENLYMGKRGMSIRVENLANPLKPYEIGKTVFLTKEEAEQALKGGAE